MIKMFKSKILFEIVSPSRMSSDKHKEKVLNSLAEQILEIKNIDFLNIPEIVDENWEGQPNYRNMNPRKFAHKLFEKTRIKSIVNKVVAHLNGEKGFKEWLDETISEYKIKEFVFVGPNTDVHSYPGPSVLKANQIAKKIPKVLVGNILIPLRQNEALKVFEKTKSGADFFTTQVLFESEKIKKVLSEYDSLCKKEKIKPAKIFLGFCPVSTKYDVEFLKWLGVEIPEKTEKDLLADNALMAQKSLNAVKSAWEDVNAFVNDNNISVPIGLNIEEIFLHNLPYCKELTDALTI